MRLFSYTISSDIGSAPNPFWGICTLTICKPVIRRVAKKEDWITGFSGNAVVYAMRVTEKRSLAEYDEYCKKKLPNKIPDWSSNDYRRKVGDCIYDYSVPDHPILRASVHTEDNVSTDLGGASALLSDDFYYFGRDVVLLPTHLLPIVHKRGHKSDANAPYISEFIDWIREHESTHNLVAADPQLKKELSRDGCRSSCSVRDKVEAEEDEQCEAHC